MTCHFIAVFKILFSSKLFQAKFGYFKSLSLLFITAAIAIFSPLPLPPPLLIFSLSLLPFWIWKMPGMCPTIELLPGPRDFTFQSLMICPPPLGSLFVTPSWRERRADSTRTASLPSLLPGVFPGCASYTDSLTPAPRRHQASSIKLSLSPNKPIGCAPPTTLQDLWIP